MTPFAQVLALIPSLTPHERGQLRALLVRPGAHTPLRRATPAAEPTAPEPAPAVRRARITEPAPPGSTGEL